MPRNRFDPAVAEREHQAFLRDHFGADVARVREATVRGSAS